MVMQLVQQEQSVLMIQRNCHQENMLGQKEEKQQHQEIIHTQRVVVQQHQEPFLTQRVIVQQHQEPFLTQRVIIQQHQEPLLMQKDGVQQHKEITNMSKVNTIYQTPLQLISLEMVHFRITVMLILQTGKVTLGLRVMFILVQQVEQIRMMGQRNQQLKSL